MDFTLNNIEKEAAEKFIKKHKKCHIPTTIGGQFSYIFTPTGVGVGVSIKCNCCEKEENITDYGCW